MYSKRCYSQISFFNNVRYDHTLKEKSCYHTQLSLTLDKLIIVVEVIRAYKLVKIKSLHE